MQETQVIYRVGASLGGLWRYAATNLGSMWIDLITVEHFELLPDDAELVHKTDGARCKKREVTDLSVSRGFMTYGLPGTGSGYERVYFARYRDSGPKAGTVN